MSKAFTRETEQEDEDLDVEPALPTGVKHYMTRRGHAVLRTEFEHLVKAERPELVKVVSWAAGNGDRSENGDYIYGKKRLREIDKRIRFLTKRLENAVVVEPAEHENVEQVFFGATVALRDSDGVPRFVEEEYRAFLGCGALAGSMPDVSISRVRRRAARAKGGPPP